jgi:UDP-2-acetamido-3-amino-2,3-dideoxy-glucuronate N-acetyltransferase
VRVAVFGAGNWGRNHVRTFCSVLGEDAVVVCDPDQARLDALTAEYPGIETCNRPSYDGIDAVVIAAPAAVHYELAQDALRAGFHVLVEKPMALTVPDGERLIRLAEEQGKVLMVDHLLEYHPAVLRLQGLIEEGRLGKLLHMTSRRLNLGVIRSEENALWSLAPHDISILLMLSGDEPISVAAHGAAFLQAGIPDLAHLTMRFADGLFAHVHVSWLDPIKTRALTVVGDAAMVTFDDTAEEPLILHEKRAAMLEGRGVPQRGAEVPVPVDSGEPLRRVAEAFVECVRTGATPRADGHDGLRVLRVLDAAQRSLDAGGAPIALEGAP